jgi:hypothetical protein
MLKPAGKSFGRYLSTPATVVVLCGQVNQTEGLHKMANAKQPTYTAFLLFKANASAEEVELMTAPLSDAQIEGREPMLPEDVAFIEEYLRAEEEHARMQEE